MQSDTVPQFHEAPQPGEPNLDSFVMRFVRSTEGPKAWHGIIRHVQSNRERAFIHWGDAVSFIKEFVTIEESPND